MRRRTTTAVPLASLAAVALLIAGCGEDDVTPALSGGLQESESETEAASESETETADGAASAGVPVEVPMVDEDDRTLGVVLVTPVGEGAGVRVDAVLEGLAPGMHAMHLHEVGECEGSFRSAEGHHVGEGGDHADHDGDLPPMLVLDDGTADYRTVTDRVDLAELTEGDGSALIIHEGADNQGNIPDRYTADDAPGPDAETLDTGDAGGRVACGVVPVEQAAEETEAEAGAGTEGGETEDEGGEGDDPSAEAESESEG